MHIFPLKALLEKVKLPCLAGGGGADGLASHCSHCSHLDVLTTGAQDTTGHKVQMGTDDGWEGQASLASEGYASCCLLPPDPLASKAPAARGW